MEFNEETRPIVEKRRVMGLQMVKPFERNSVFKVKGKEKDFVIVGREADRIELDDPIHFAKERGNFFIFAAKHTRVTDFD